MFIDAVIINRKDITHVPRFDYFHIQVKVCDLLASDLEDLHVTWNGITLNWHRTSKDGIANGTTLLSIYVNTVLIDIKKRNELAVICRDSTCDVIIRNKGTFHPENQEKLRQRIEKKRARLKGLLKADVNVREDGVVIAVDDAFDHTLKHKTDKVSAHGYNKIFKKILSESDDDFIALDLGAGMRFVENPMVICLEIFDYPSTDVIAFGDDLPFKSESLDCVYTSAVLEHVENPFDVANEIARVLKPGGTVISSIPFLQIEHGYPHHYFNATRMGHRRLYEQNFTITDQFIGDAGHPFSIIKQALGTYRNSVKQSHRAEFDALTVSDLLTMSYKDLVGSDYGEVNNEEVLWKLAGATTIIGTKI